LQEDAFRCLAAACLHNVLQAAVDLPKPPASLAEICTALDWDSADTAESMLKELKVALKDDLTSISVSDCFLLTLVTGQRRCPQTPKHETHDRAVQYMLCIQPAHCCGEGTCIRMSGVCWDKVC
jgi:hypothetical protein